MQKFGEEVEILLEVPATANCASIIGAGYLAVLERRGMSQPEVRQFRKIAEQLINVMLDEKTVNATYINVRFWFDRECPLPASSPKLNVPTDALSKLGPVQAKYVYLDITRSDSWMVATESVLLMNKKINRTIRQHKAVKHAANTHDSSVSGSTAKAEIEIVDMVKGCLRLTTQFF